MSDARSGVKFLLKMTVCADSIHKSFQAPNEVYKRALRRLRDGHIDAKSFTVIQAVRDDTKENIRVFTAQVAASLRLVLYIDEINCN